MTVVEVRPARQHQVTLRLSSGDEVTIDKTTWEESPYGVDSSLSIEQLDALMEASIHRRAKSRAVYLLSKRDYSRRELEQKLCRERGRYVADKRDVARETAACMEELGYVNDRAYAERLAVQYQRERLYPRRRTVQKLQEKGIAREVAEEAVAAVDADDCELALEFLQKRRYTIPQNKQEAEKTAAALARYGFVGEDIRRAMRRWTEEDYE